MAVAARAHFRIRNVAGPACVNPCKCLDDVWIPQESNVLIPITYPYVPRLAEAERAMGIENTALIPIIL